MSIQEEQDLLFDLRHGNEKAFNTIFSLYYENMIKTALRLGSGLEDAKDIVMDAFSKAWIKRDCFNTLYKLKCYIYVIVKHAVFHLREKTIELKSLRIPHNHYENDGFKKLTNQDDRAIVNILTKDLKQRELAIIDICFVQEQKPIVASRELNIDKDQLRVFKFRAIRQMRDKLKSHI